MEIYLSPVAVHQNYKYMSLCPDFFNVGSGDQTLVLMLNRKALTYWDIFPTQNTLNYPKMGTDTQQKVRGKPV